MAFDTDSIRPQYKWRDSETQPLQPSPHAQASKVHLVYKWRGYFRGGDDELFVCKTLPCGNQKKARYTHSEYKILQDLKHKNIVRYEDFEYQRGKRIDLAFLYLEYCPGGDLGVYLPSKGVQAGKLTADQAQQIIQQISSALVYIHYGILIPVRHDGRFGVPKAAKASNSATKPGRWSSIIHRDIKPQNIFIYSGGKGGQPIHVKLGDFGFAKLLLEEENATMSYVGTREYLAPECRRISMPIQITPKSDVWAFGATMRAITSHLPDSNYTTNLVKQCCTDDITQRLSSFQLLELTVDDIPILHRLILYGFISSIIDLELIIRLLEDGADPRIRDVHGITPMHLAALQGPYRTSNSRELINLLLDKKLSLSCKDNYGWSPLHWARASDPDDSSGIVAHFLPALETLEIDAISDTPFDVRSATEILVCDWDRPFVTAAALGNIGILDRLCDLHPPHFVSKGESSSMWISLQLVAAASGQNDVLKFVLERTGFIYMNMSYPANYKGVKYGYGNALQAASHGGHEEIVKRLLEIGVDINKWDENFNSALQTASYAGHDKVVKQLLNAGAIIDENSKTYGSALRAALYGGHEMTVKQLVDKGADINGRGKTYGNALRVAIYGGHRKEVKELLDVGVDANARGGDFGNALQVAACRGHESVVEQLLNAGALVNEHNGDYGSALHVASYCGHEKVVKQLLEAKANACSNESPYGQTPLSRAAEGGHVAVVRLLLEQEGVDANSKDHNGRTPLSWASEKGHKAVAKLLLKHGGVDANSKDKNGATPLFWAASRGQKAVVQLLLDQEGVDTNSTDNDGLTALSLAAITMHTATAKLLLEHKDAGINSKDDNGETPLFLAAREGCEDMVRLLLKYGANIYVRNKYGETVEHQARSRGDESMVRLLETSGKL